MEDIKIEGTGLFISSLSFERDCDGCGKTLPKDTPIIFGIESCCGGGCCRNLCFSCIEKAHTALWDFRAMRG